jgi:Double-GTPase 2
MSFSGGHDIEPIELEPMPGDELWSAAGPVVRPGVGSASPAAGLASPGAGPLADPGLPDLPEEGPPKRDRIVVLGRRQSGKTIYLACIYARLWKAMKGMTATALSGQAHKHLMTTYEMLKKRQWPPSTLGTSHIDIEIEYHGKKRLLVMLDFAGELFTKAFVDEQTDWPGVRELVDHIDHAAAVLLLADPAVIAGMDREAALEDDFGLVQAIQRIRNWPGGENVPFVLVLTKSDQHQELLDRYEGALSFVRRHFPALVRTVKEIPIVQVSAVQADRGRDGKLRPKRDSVPMNLDLPLRYCLREMERNEERGQRERYEDEQRAMQARMAVQAQHQDRRQRLLTTVAAASISLVGLAVVILILAFRV